MLRLHLFVAVGTLLGAAMGCFGQWMSGTCPLMKIVFDNAYFHVAPTSSNSAWPRGEIASMLISRMAVPVLYYLANGRRGLCRPPAPLPVLERAKP